MPRKRPKSLDAQVTIQAKQLEAWAYYRCDQWKKTYRFTLVNEFRSHITNSKNAIILALELPNRDRHEKSHLYSVAMGELAIVESNMDIMIMDQFNIMSEKEWAQAAKKIDDIRVAISRLLYSLYKSTGGTESPNCGTGSESSGYKDA